MNGLMRMRIAPGAERMVISTNNGYILVIHDLDLNHIRKDLFGFKVKKTKLVKNHEN